MGLSLGTVLLSELLGTAVLVLMGTGVVANALLTSTKGSGGGFLMINFGWGLGVFAGACWGRCWSGSRTRTTSRPPRTRR